MSDDAVPFPVILDDGGDASVVQDAEVVMGEGQGVLGQYLSGPGQMDDQGALCGTIAIEERKTESGISFTSAPSRNNWPSSIS